MTKSEYSRVTQFLSEAKPYVAKKKGASLSHYVFTDEKKAARVLLRNARRGLASLYSVVYDPAARALLIKRGLFYASRVGFIIGRRDVHIESPVLLVG